VKPRFSDRIGATKPPTTLQVGEMSDPLRNRLWNFVYTCLTAEDRVRSGIYSHSCWEPLCRAIVRDVLKQPLDKAPLWKRDSAIEWLHKTFFAWQWHEAYNLVEFIVELAPQLEGFPFRQSHLVQAVNEILADELAGYRFVDGMLAPISNPTEAAAIEDAMTGAAAFGLYGVQEHIQTALALLGQRPQPDYRNSIKESISAVEAAAKAIAGEPKATLGPALDKLSTRLQLHGALKEGFQKLYGYTSDANGIRHALMDEPTLDLDDAKYMLVSCSAFATFLISKAATAGLIKAGGQR